jgi:CBS domain-containing protein
MQVSEVMTTDVATVSRNDNLRLVDDIMAECHIRHVPVVEDGAIVGLVSQRDVFKARMSSTMESGEKGQRSFLHTVLVTDMMSHPVITIAPETPVTEAVDLIIDKGIGCLPVVRDHRLIGIITKTNLLQRLRTLSATEREREWSPDKTRIERGLANVMPY